MKASLKKHIGLVTQCHFIKILIVTKEAPLNEISITTTEGTRKARILSLNSLFNSYILHDVDETTETLTGLIDLIRSNRWRIESMAHFMTDKQVVLLAGQIILIIRDSEHPVFRVK